MPTFFLENNTIKFHYIERDWIVLRADMEKLWEEMAELSQSKQKNLISDEGETYNDERLPYWAELWPSSLALSKWLYQNAEIIRYKTCMDLGCGLGFTALCGAYVGANVLAVDYEAKAISLAKENANANGFSLSKGELDFQEMDWRNPFIPKQSQDFIWAADIVYERSFAKPVLDFLSYALKKHGKAWIAEPSRSIFDEFLKLINDQKKLRIKKVYYEQTPSLSQNIPSARVTIWEIEKI